MEAIRQAERVAQNWQKKAELAEQQKEEFKEREEAFLSSFFWILKVFDFGGFAGEKTIQEGSVSVCL